jgi:uncharacterized protein YjbJ (UPF0337 family)
LARSSEAAPGLFHSRPTVISPAPIWTLAHRTPRALCVVFLTVSVEQQLRRPTIFNFNLREHTMNKDQSKGRVEEVKGKVKEVAGKIIGDKTMEHKGKIQNLKGQAQAGYGDLKADIKKVT